MRSAPRKALLWLSLIALVIGGWALFTAGQSPSNAEKPFPQFLAELTTDNIKSVIITGTAVDGVLRDGTRLRTTIPQSEKGVYQLFRVHNVSVSIRRTFWATVFLWVVRLAPAAIVCAALWILVRRRAHSTGMEVLAFLRLHIDRYLNGDLSTDRHREPDLTELIRAIEAPSWAGSITGRVLPAGQIRAVVLCVQDLHANVGVQRHESEMIGKLVNVHGFRHVFVEGASGPGDLQLLASLPPLVRAAFMDGLLNRAYLTGSEYAGASRPDWDFELWGVDDPNLYRSNWRPAEAIDVVRDNIVNASYDFRQRVIRACAPIVSKEFSDFLDSVDRQRADGLSTDTPKYVRYLALYAAAYSITIPTNLRPLLSNLTGRKVGQNSGASDQLTDSVQSAADIPSLESEIGDAIARTTGNPADLPYKFLIDAIDLASRAFRIGMQNEEARRFFAFDAKGLDLRVKDAVAKINHLLGTSDAKLGIPPDFELVFANWNLPQAFYRTALARSDAMLTNIASQITRRQIDRGIFVSGGFHTAYVASQLAHRHGIATVIFTPKVEKLDQEKAYRARMREDLRANAMDSEPRISGPSFTLANSITKLQNTLTQMLLATYLRTLFNHAQSFAAQSAILSGSEAILEVKCSETELLPLLSPRLQEGIVTGVDQFDFFMGGNEINLNSPQAYLARIYQTTGAHNTQVINMNPRFMYYKDEALDWVISLTLDRIKRVADRREVLREALRCLKPGGVILLFAGPHCDEYARTLLKLDTVDVTRIETSRYCRRLQFLAAIKAGPQRLKDRVELGNARCRVAAKQNDGRIVWAKHSAGVPRVI